MKGAARVAMVIGASLALAWGLSYLPEFRSQDVSPVFQLDKAAVLNESNLVDALTAIPLELDIAKADYRQSVLSVDLFWPTGVSGERFVYHDLYELSHFAWSSTSNVERIVIRVLIRQGQGRQTKELLLAMEAKRSQAKGTAEPAGGPAAIGELKSFLESRYQFSYAPKWKDLS